MESNGNDCNYMDKISTFSMVSTLSITIYG